MTTSDPIADMLTRIRNAILVHKETVNMPHSKLKQQVAEILKESGFVSNVEAIDAGAFKRLVITINTPGSNPKISEIRRISSPGRRQYAKAVDIPVVMNGRGMVIVSTSHGMMNGDQAKAKNIGGELICKVY